MLKIPATFDRYSSRSDGSMGVSFSTQEASASDLAMIHAHVRQFGWLLFDENEIQSEDIPKEGADEEKSPSKRLRSVLFVLWKQEGEKGDFEIFYRDRMNKLIDWTKSKLDPV